MSTTQAFTKALSLAKSGIQCKLSRISKGVWVVTIEGEKK